MKAPISGTTAARILVVLLVDGLLVGVGFFVWNIGRNSHWWGTSDRQHQLLADPMAARDLLGLTLVGEKESMPAGILGKSRGPFVHHWFDTHGAPQDMLAELGRYATESDWAQQADLSEATVWVGRKPDGNGNDLRIVIQIEGANGPSTAPSVAGNLRVSLTQ